MVLQRSRLGTHPLLLIVLFLAAVTLAMAVLPAVLGVQLPAWSYEIVQDPAAAAGLPF